MGRRFTESEVLAMTRNRREEKALRGRLLSLSEEQGMYQDNLKKEKRKISDVFRESLKTSGNSPCPESGDEPSDTFVSLQQMRRHNKPWSVTPSQTTFNVMFKQNNIPSLAYERRNRGQSPRKTPRHSTEISKNDISSANMMQQEKFKTPPPTKLKAPGIVNNDLSDCKTLNQEMMSKTFITKDVTSGYPVENVADNQRFSSQKNVADQVSKVHMKSRRSQSTVQKQLSSNTGTKPSKTTEQGHIIAVGQSDDSAFISNSIQSDFYSQEPRGSTKGSKLINNSDSTRSYKDRGLKISNSVRQHSKESEKSESQEKRSTTDLEPATHGKRLQSRSSVTEDWDVDDNDMVEGKLKETNVLSKGNTNTYSNKRSGGNGHNLQNKRTEFTSSVSSLDKSTQENFKQITSHAPSESLRDKNLEESNVHVNDLLQQRNENHANDTEFGNLIEKAGDIGDKYLVYYTLENVERNNNEKRKNVSIDHKSHTITRSLTNVESNTIARSLTNVDPNTFHTVDVILENGGTAAITISEMEQQRPHTVTGCENVSDDPDQKSSTDLDNRDYLWFKGKKLHNYVRPQDRYKHDPFKMKKREKLMKKLATETPTFAEDQREKVLNVELTFSKATRARLLKELVEENSSRKQKCNHNFYEQELTSKIENFFKSIENFCQK